MKIVVIILGILGSLGAIGIGSKWLSDYNKNKDQIAQIEQLTKDSGSSAPLDEAMSQLNKAVKAAYILIVMGIASLIAAVMVSKLTKISGIIMLLTALIPAVIVPVSLVFTFFLLIAGGLAFLIKPQRAVA